MDSVAKNQLNMALLKNQGGFQTHHFIQQHSRTENNGMISIDDHNANGVNHSSNQSNPDSAGDTKDQMIELLTSSNQNSNSSQSGKMVIKPRNQRTELMQ